MHPDTCEACKPGGWAVGMPCAHPHSRDPVAGSRRLLFVLGLFFQSRVLVAVGFILFLISLLLVIAWPVSQDDDAFRYLIVDSLAPWLVWLVATLLLVLGLWSWSIHRRRFFETESFVILALMALLASISQGLINHRLYLSSPQGFYIEQEAAEAFKESRDLELKERKERSQRRLATYADLEQDMPRPGGAFQVHWLYTEQSVLETVDAWCFETAESTVRFELKRILVQVINPKGPPARPRTLTQYTFFAMYGEEEFSLDPTSLQDAFKKVAEAPEQFPAAPLLALIRQRVQAEKELLEDIDAQLQSLGSKAAFRLSAWFFIHQSMMDILGDNPQHVKPASFQTRLSALVFACLKFFFFTALIVTLSRRWSRPAEPASRG